MVSKQRDHEVTAAKELVGAPNIPAARHIREACLDRAISACGDQLPADIVAAAVTFADYTCNGGGEQKDLVLRGLLS